MERSAEEFPLDQPIDTSHVNDGAAETIPAERSFRREDIEGVCTNPLHDEPHEVIVGAVKRFGLVGLIVCAVGAAMLRGWHSLTGRKH